MERHIHKAHYDEDGNLTDECDKCGRDIREEIHIRSKELNLEINKED